MMSGKGICRKMTAKWNIFESEMEFLGHTLQENIPKEVEVLRCLQIL
jgi:hypothetical protein